MLTEQRHSMIVDLVNKRGSITIRELKKELDISESTARRDIVTLDKLGKLEKVFGGAISLKEEVSTFEPTVAQKASLNTEEKNAIAEYASALIEASDVVFIDSGTTTLALANYIPSAEDVIFVTNGIVHAQILAAKGNRVMLIGGMLKNATEAVIGSTAVLMVQQFNFTKGFFGVNGISRRLSLTTPEYEEASFKQEAMKHCKQCYVLADSSKFDVTTSVTFGNGKAVKIITDRIPEGYEDYANIIIQANAFNDFQS